MDNRAALNAARHRLALLRSAGVKVRNNGMETDILFEGLDAWCTEAEKWNEDVKSALAEIDPAMAEWFATLDAVPLPRVRPDKWANGRHAKMFHEHDFRLLKLERLILETPVVR